VKRVPLPPRFDVACAAALVVLAVGEVWFNDAIPAKPASTVLEVGMAGAIAWRRAAPLTACAVVALGSAADAAIGVSPDKPAIPMVTAVVMIYALVSYGSLRRAIVGTVILACGTIAQVVIAHQSLGNLGFAFTFMTVFWAIGRLVRVRTAQAVRAELQVARLEDERLEQSRRIAAEERGRIARELHDVIAHSVSVMVVQSGAAQQVLRVNAEAAERSLESVQSTGRQAIAELGQLLGVLREGGAELGLAPQPTLTELPDLIGAAEAAGLSVTLETVGTARKLPPSVELTVYRVVQEALTNTRKHAGASAVAAVRLRYGSDEVEVRDEGRADGRTASPGPVSGHGLVGMAERLTTLGGSLSAAQHASGGFRVHARIPLGAAS
jgi:signal transduction histidine kinase